MRALARAYGDEPLERVVTGVTPRVAYLINPSTVSSTEIEPNTGVGFPRDCVFRFDRDLFDSLSVAWREHNPGQLRSLWQKAQPLDS